MSSSPSPQSIVLLSGGLDSAVALALAQRESPPARALTFDYGQRHGAELDAARAVAGSARVERDVIRLDSAPFRRSALTDRAAAVPKDRTQAQIDADGVPETYVPARNLVFLSLAAGLAETLGAKEVWIGVNAIDYSGYPDCRPEFIEALQTCLRLGTKRGVDDAAVRIRAPLIDKTKAEIIRLGVSLGVDFALTRSCYDPTPEGLACGECDACALRRKGFVEAGAPDPTLYAHRE